MNQYTGVLSIYSGNVLLSLPYLSFLEFGVFSHMFGVLWLTASFFLVDFVRFVLAFWTKKNNALILTHNC